MKAALLVVYGVTAFACGAWALVAHQSKTRRPETLAEVAFVIAVMLAALIWRL